MALINVKTLEIAGIGSVLQALRLPFGKECRSHADFNIEVNEKDRFVTHSFTYINEKDLHLLSTLVKRGDEHAKAVRGLIVYAEIEAPRYWWQEMDTYYVGTSRLSSSSTMHIQGKGLSTEELVAMKDALPEGTMQKRVQMFSYQTLRRIYFQRKDHRLPHWQIFCDWIRTLPFSEELITIVK